MTSNADLVSLHINYPPLPKYEILQKLFPLPCPRPTSASLRSWRNSSPFLQDRTWNLGVGIEQDKPGDILSLIRSLLRELSYLAETRDTAEILSLTCPPPTIEYTSKKLATSPHWRTLAKLFTVPPRQNAESWSRHHGR